MSNATIKERRERYHKAQKKRGNVLVQLWVPATDREELREYARRLRQSAGDYGPEPKRRKG